MIKNMTIWQKNSEIIYTNKLELEHEIVCIFNFLSTINKSKQICHDYFGFGWLGGRILVDKYQQSYLSWFAFLAHTYSRLTFLVMYSWLIVNLLQAPINPLTWFNCISLNRIPLLYIYNYWVMIGLQKGTLPSILTSPIYPMNMFKSNLRSSMKHALYQDLSPYMLICKRKYISNHETKQASKF